MEYLDFEVIIEEGGGSAYRVAVIRSPAGEGRETAQWPFDKEQLKAHLAGLHSSLLGARGGREVVPIADRPLESGQRAARDFGRVLFKLLFQDSVGELYRESLQEARRKPDRGLRLKLRTQAPELATLPWELLHDPRTDDFVCLSTATPLVRYVEAAEPPQPLVVTPPLRILGMVASPTDLAVLDVGREKAIIEKAVADVSQGGMVDITWLEGQTWEALQTAMVRGGPWHVFHFIGHGGYDPNINEGHIALATEEGGRYDLSAIALSRMLGDHRTLRLVVLNACEGARGGGTDLFSSTATTLVRRGLPAVVSMQNEISDKAAIEFAKAFYRCVLRGVPVDLAISEARKVMSFKQPRSLEWATPVLHMRSSDGRLFQIDEPGVSPSTLPKAEAKHMAEQVETHRDEEAVAAPRDLDSLRTLIWMQMTGIVAGMVTYVTVGLLGFVSAGFDDGAPGAMVPYWLFLSITGAMIGRLSFQRRRWLGVLFGSTVFAPLWLFFNGLYPSLGVVLVFGVAVLATGMALLRRLRAQNATPSTTPLGGSRVLLPLLFLHMAGVLVLLFLALFSSSRAARVISAALGNSLAPEGGWLVITWLGLLTSGACLVITGVRRGVRPAAILGWATALFYLPFARNILLAFALPLPADLTVNVRSLLYVPVSFFLFVQTLLVLRNRRRTRVPMQP